MQGAQSAGTSTVRSHLQGAEVHDACSMNGLALALRGAFPLFELVIERQRRWEVVRERLPRFRPHTCMQNRCRYGPTLSVLIDLQ